MPRDLEQPQRERMLTGGEAKIIGGKGRSRGGMVGGAQAPLLPLNLWSPFKNFCNDGFEEERLEVEDVEYEDKLATSASLASDVCNH
jgi:hypothetical protein